MNSKSAPTLAKPRGTAHRLSAMLKFAHKNRVGYDRTVGEETWLTPRYITDALGGPSTFDVDPCSPDKRPWDIAKVHFNKKQDGFDRTWAKKDFMWINPPYGSECKSWVEKAAAHGNNLVLIFARTETQMFHKYVWSHPNATAIFFFEGRLSFCTMEGESVGTAGAPSVLVAYGKKAQSKLEKAVKNEKLKGVLVPLMGLKGVQS